ncbi:hypothetical protein IAU60_001220 [Kwoniella sp. DSM 27419]
MVLRNPTSVLAQFAITSIDMAIAVYSALIKQNNSPSMVKNHDWLLRLRHRAFDKVVSQAQAQVPNRATAGEGPDEEEDLDIVGWKTRLIESAANGSQIAVNISHPTATRTTQDPLPYTPAPSLPVMNSTGVVPAVQQVLQQHLVGPAGFDMPEQGNVPLGTDSQTDLLSANWWSWDLGMNEPRH